MPPFGVTRFVVQPEKILVRLALVLAVDIWNQVHSVAMLGDGQASHRGDGGIEVEVRDLLVVILALGDDAGHGENGRHADPAFLLSPAPFPPPVRRGGTVLAPVGPIVAGEYNQCVLAHPMLFQSFHELAHLVVARDDGSGQFASFALGRGAIGQAGRSFVILGMHGFRGPI